MARRPRTPDDQKATGGTPAPLRRDPPSRGRREGQARGAKIPLTSIPPRGEEDRKNMRFCETNPIVMLANSVVTCSNVVSCDYGCENSNRVRLGKPNPFPRKRHRDVLSDSALKMRPKWEVKRSGRPSVRLCARSGDRRTTKPAGLARNPSGFAPDNPATARVEEKGKMTRRPRRICLRLVLKMVKMAE